MLTLLFARAHENMLELFQNGLITIIKTPHITLVYYVFLALCAIVPYLLGSFNTAVFVTKRLVGEDVREKGSGNAGLTNTNRVYGARVALFVLLGDGLKALLSVLFAGLLFGMQYVFGFACSSIPYMAALFCVIGHVFPVFYRFKGGKGVLCTFVSALVLSPLVTLILFAIFALILVTTKYVSLGSVIAGVMYCFVLNRMMGLFSLFPDGLITLSTIAMGLLIVWCHRENIKRIMNKTESKFSFKKRR